MPTDETTPPPPIDETPKVDTSPQLETQPVEDERYYRITWVGDFGAGERLAAPAPVDKEDFAPLLARSLPELRLRVKVAGFADEVEAVVKIGELRDFSPERFLPQIPTARWRLGVRDKLRAALSGDATAEDVKTALEAAASADSSLRWLTAAPAEDRWAAPAAGGGSILDQVDEPDPGRKFMAEIEHLISASSSQLAPDVRQRIKAVLPRLEGELETLANAVLKDADFRALECAWRSLRFVIDRVDFRERIRMEIVGATRDEAAEALINQVINPALDGARPTPNLIVFDYGIKNEPVDFALLDRAAQFAAALPVPLTFPVEAAFFDVKNMRLLKNLPNFKNLMGGWQFAKYRSLREQRHARVLVPVLGRLILRQPYERKEKSSAFTCDEQANAISDLLWAHGHLAVPICAARSFAQHKWPTRMFGSEMGKLEDLPIVPNPHRPDEPWGPGDLTLPERRITELPAVGMNFLQSLPGKDECVLVGGVSAAMAPSGDQQAMREVSLPYQQFANVVSDWLCTNVPLQRGKPANEIQESVLFGLARLLGLKSAEEMEAVQIGVGPHPEDPNVTLIAVHLDPPARLVPGGVHMELTLAV